MRLLKMGFITSQLIHRMSATSLLALWYLWLTSLLNKSHMTVVIWLCKCEGKMVNYYLSLPYHCNSWPANTIFNFFQKYCVVKICINILDELFIFNTYYLGSAPRKWCSLRWFNFKFRCKNESFIRLLFTQQQWITFPFCFAAVFLVLLDVEVWLRTISMGEIYEIYVQHW